MRWPWVSRALYDAVVAERDRLAADETIKNLTAARLVFIEDKVAEVGAALRSELVTLRDEVMQAIATEPGQTLAIPPEERAVKRLSDDAREAFVSELRDIEGLSEEQARAAWAQVEASVVGES